MKTSFFRRFRAIWLVLESVAVYISQNLSVFKHFYVFFARKKWIFRGISKVIDPLHPTVIFGNNGSGKSTLMKLITSSEIPSEGSIKYQIGDNVIPEDKVFSYIGMATPYMDLPEEFTLSEILQFRGH